jgi:hypothetical protein
MQQFNDSFAQSGWNGSWCGTCVKGLFRNTTTKDWKETWDKMQETNAPQEAATQEGMPEVGTAVIVVPEVSKVIQFSSKVEARKLLKKKTAVDKKLRAATQLICVSLKV